MEESVLHKIIKTNMEVQKKMLSILNINDDNILFNSEDQYPNGMFADFTILSGNNVKAIVELKGSNIGVNDYVRGTGQLFQYQHFIDENLSIKSYDYSEAITVFCFPSSLLTDKKYNIGLFTYPKQTVILEFNETNYSFRKITQKDLNVFAGARGKDMITVSPYYIRDTRLFEIYIALRYFQILKLMGNSTINRKDSDTYLQQLQTPDNGNWRNVFITLSSLGLTDENNIPTDIGAEYANLSFEGFAYEIYNSYIKQYFSIILTIILTLPKDCGSISLEDIRKKIIKQYQNKDVLFITDSGTRYISSWLNIMKDDFRCIYYPPHKPKKEFTINYEIHKYNKEAILNEIKKNPEPYKYINKFNSLMSQEFGKKGE